MDVTSSDREFRDTATRFVFLDGLRGWAAVSVAVYHVFYDAFPLIPWLPRFFLFNGTLDVYCFFLISGFSLSVGFIRSGHRVGLLKLPPVGTHDLSFQSLRYAP